MSHLRCKRWCIVHTFGLILILSDTERRLCSLYISKTLQNMNLSNNFFFLSTFCTVSHVGFVSLLVCFHRAFEYLSIEWAVSGGLWHDCDVFCCCFNHTASCFSVTDRVVLIMKNVLPSFPLNQLSVESLIVPALISLLEVLSFISTGDESGHNFENIFIYFSYFKTKSSSLI